MTKEQSSKCIGPTFVLLEEGFGHTWCKKIAGPKTFLNGQLLIRLLKIAYLAENKLLGSRANLSCLTSNCLPNGCENKAELKTFAKFTHNGS